MEVPFEGSGLGPQVEGAKLVVRFLGWFDVWGALLEPFAHVVRSGKSGGKSLNDEGIFGDVGANFGGM